MAEDQIILSVPISALAASAQERIAELTRERDEARRQCGAFRIDSSLADAQMACLRAERDAARADLAVAENTLATALRSRDEWFDAHEAMRQEREDMRHERDAAKASVYALTTERDEEKARRLEAERELELARVEAEAKTNQSAWEAACRLRKERDEARADLSVARGLDQAVRDILKIRDGVSLTGTVKQLVEERDEARAALSKARESAETERIDGRVATDFLNARIATLETAIRDLAKVLP